MRAGVRRAQQLHPQVQRVHELPVVHGLDRLLLLEGHRVPQADAQLPHVHEGVVVGGLL